MDDELGVMVTIHIINLVHILRSVLFSRTYRH